MVALRIVFLGTPAFAVPTLRALLNSRHPVVGVVTQPDRPRGRGHRVTMAPVKELAVQHGLPVLQPEKLRDGTAATALRGWNPDLGVVAAYGRIIPAELLSIPRLGMINVHASLLPRYRGAAPVHRAVIDGERETGVTIMRVVPELDAGAMFAKVTRPIKPEDTSDVVEHDLAELGASLLVDVVNAMADGPAVEEPQDSSLATYAAKITKEDAPIAWTLPANAIHNRVRGLYPWPHAHTTRDGRRLILLQTQLLDATSDQSPGTVVDVTRDAVHVVAGDGRVLAITRLHLEGQRPLTAREFLAGHPIAVGTRLGP